MVGFKNYYNKIKICIVCEGYEEYDYLDRLIKLNIFDKAYDINLVNAKGNGNIFARYQDIYQRNKYHIIFVFCDTEQKPYEQFMDIKDKIDELYDQKGISDKLVIFANPCTMQIILFHFGDIVLKSSQKAKNAEDIERLTGIKGYNASEEKRKELFDKITKENYGEMRERIKSLSTNSNDENSSNISKFFDYLEEYYEKWYESINKN
ncbi:MAG: hypothetical protein IJP71_04250 [Lachnospiraceae bacterium]|nr:hypothetical protein [Lachnospiraceae bacterium]